MKQVRIILIEDQYDYHDDDGTSVNPLIREGISDWEEITDDEYRLLKSNWWRLVRDIGASGTRPVLLEKDCMPVRHRIDSIRGWLRAEQEKMEADLAAKRAKAEERARKKLLKDTESEMKLLEELRKKYPGV